MAIMESLSQNSTFLDPFRKKWIKSRPEELIRQAILKEMVERLGYPPAYIAIEKELKSLPHLQLEEQKLLPKRRLDIVVFAKTSALFPLLLVECKATTPLSIEFASQVIGYNAVVQAPFVAIANEEQVLLGRWEEGHFRFTEGLPHYHALCSAVT